jgi:cellulose synthase/poly-beta-1,6-N-acetylglucosamine synthase-like glycosyltransferase
MRHWRVQQRRWASGFAQIARKLTWPIWRSHWSVMQKLLAGFLILYQAIFPVATLASVALILDFAMHGGHIPPALLLLEIIVVEIVLVAVGVTLPPYLELRRGNIGRYLRTVIAIPPLILYLSFANARPIVAAFFGRNEAFKRTPKAAVDH